MRLGVLLDRYDPSRGGAEAHTALLLERALEGGDEVVLATLQGQGPRGAETIHVRAPRRRPARDRAFADRGADELRAAGADVVLAFRHAPRAEVFLPHGGLVLDAIRARDRARGRSEGFGRALARLLSPKVRFFLEAERAVLGGEEGPDVVAVSQALAARIRAVYPASRDRVVVVGNGVDRDRFDPAPFRAAGEALRREAGLSDAYVGLLLARNPLLKGLETALLAMGRREALGLDPPFHLVVAGGPLPRRSLRLARRLGVETRLHPRPWATDVRPLLAAADVLVHPTFHDPCSLVCLEALAMGVPVVTTSENGVGEAMGMRGGIVVEEAGNPEALAIALAVLGDPALRAVTGDDARELTRRHRQRDRLDQVLAICRARAARRGSRGGR